MYHRDGGKGVQVTESKPETLRSQRHNALGAVASADGRFLYYARRSGGFEYNADSPMWQIARRDLEYGDEDILTTAQGSALRPRLSPDGRVLVYAIKNGRLYQAERLDQVWPEQRRLPAQWWWSEGGRRSLRQRPRAARVRPLRRTDSVSAAS